MYVFVIVVEVQGVRAIVCAERRELRSCFDMRGLLNGSCATCFECRQALTACNR